MSGEDKTNKTKMLSYGPDITVLTKDGELNISTQVEELLENHLDMVNLFTISTMVCIPTDHSNLSLE
jgi:hypothetical protein